ncbi:MAG TPA: hypothetical protein VGL29_05485 [Blastocatellia bacterium]
MENAESVSHSDNTATKMIALDELHEADTLSVQTKESKYQFSVLDPSRRMGTLTGGVLGHEIFNAYLSGTMSGDNTNFDSRELKTGARALFFIDLRNSARRLITSVITDIVLDQGCRRRELPHLIREFLEGCYHTGRA